ncbi:MAG: hypothetical protein ACYCZJ_13165 [Sulfuriferula sp.]
MSDINNVMRQVMADVRTLAASGSIASASTTDLGSLDATFLTVTGAIGINSFGTVDAGIYKIITFDSALTITYNATSMILPGAVDKVTAAGDTALFVSLGAGNWKCVFYGASTGYAALAGNSAQTFDVAAATAGSHAVNKTLADALYTPISYSTQGAFGADTTLTTSQVLGQSYSLLSGITVTLPNAPAGGNVTFFADSATSCYVTIPSGIYIRLPDGTAINTGLTYELPPYCTLELLSNGAGAGWDVIRTTGKNIIQNATVANQPVAYGQAFTLGQSWQEVTGSRASGVTYTNSTGKAIFISIRSQQASSGYTNLVIDGLPVGTQQQNTIAGGGTISSVIPNGSTYRYDTTNNCFIYELR